MPNSQQQKVCRISLHSAGTRQSRSTLPGIGAASLHDLAGRCRVSESVRSVSMQTGSPCCHNCLQINYLFDKSGPAVRKEGGAGWLLVSALLRFLFDSFREDLCGPDSIHVFPPEEQPGFERERQGDFVFRDIARGKL